jgi:hypothetical protein
VSVDQSLPHYGDEVYHEQVMDIAVYDENFVPTIFENMRILPQAQTVSVIKGLKKKPAAILLNANNKGYCRVTLDNDSKTFFLTNL